MADYIPKKELEYQTWLGNFITVTNANLVALGLTTTDIGPLSTEKTTFDAAITSAETLQAQSKAAIEKKVMFHKSTESKARALVKRIQAKADVTADLKRQLQITIPGDVPAPPVKPNAPSDLTVSIAGTGAYELKWKKNNTSAVIMYSVEAKIGAATGFISVFTTTKASYIHSGNTPGVKIVYQIRAIHGEVYSEPSNHVIVNDGVIG